MKWKKNYFRIPFEFVYPLIYFNSFCILFLVFPSSSRTPVELLCVCVFLYFAFSAQICLWRKMLINFSRLNNFSISFRCIWIAVLYGIECVLYFKICIFIIKKKKKKKKIINIFLSLETKRSLEWNVNEENKNQTNEWRNLSTQTNAFSHLVQLEGWYERKLYVFVWAAGVESATKCSWNGTLNECFKNTIKQKRGCTEKIVYFLSKFTIRSYFCSVFFCF